MWTETEENRRPMGEQGDQVLRCWLAEEQTHWSSKTKLRAEKTEVTGDKNLPLRKITQQQEEIDFFKTIFTAYIIL